MTTSSSPGTRSRGGPPVVVVGGSIAGIAAAARLAKAGVPVILLESHDRIGGRWASQPMDDIRVDAAPSVLSFPAPWRDLLRKSGRPFDVELQRHGYTLQAAVPVRHLFADGTELLLPTDRGEQYAALAGAYGTAVAQRWRTLLDAFDDVWQTVRPLGLEAELRSRSQLTAAVRRRLRSRQTLEQLAQEVDQPHLAALLRLVAYRLGSVPSRTPAWCAIDLATERTFGRWVLDGAESGRSSVLVDVLTDRLRQRRVDVRLGTTVAQIGLEGSRATTVRTTDGQQVDAAAVICTTDPWQTYDDLLPRGAARAERRALHRLRPALAPAVQHHLEDSRCAEVTETVLHAPSGPVVTYRRPLGERTVVTTHDFGAAEPTRSAGVAWRGWSSWLRRPPTTSAVTGLFLAGPFSRGGAQPSHVVLSGALASYACYDYLG